MNTTNTQNANEVKAAGSNGRQFLSPGPYSILQREVRDLAGKRGLTKMELDAVLRAASTASILSAQFDEKWYLGAYPDVQLAVAEKKYRNGYDHFQALGYFENRLPMKIEVDEVFYCSQYPDIGKAIDIGLIASAKLHFMTKGYAEGRMPSRSFSFATLSALKIAKLI